MGEKVDPTTIIFGINIWIQQETGVGTADGVSFLDVLWLRQLLGTFPLPDEASDEVIVYLSTNKGGHQ